MTKSQLNKGPVFTICCRCGVEVARAEVSRVSPPLTAVAYGAKIWLPLTQVFTVAVCSIREFA